MKLRYSILALALASSVGSLHAQSLRGEDLVSKSPFVPAESNTPASQAQAPTQQSDLEFRGVYSLGERYFFNVFDRRENKGTWLELNKEANGLQISGFDREQRSISLNVGGRLQTLMMPRPSDQTMPVQLAAAPATNNAVRGAATPIAGENNRVVRRTGTNPRTINRTVPPPPLLPPGPARILPPPFRAHLIPSHHRGHPAAGPLALRLLRPTTAPGPRIHLPARHSHLLLHR